MGPYDHSMSYEQGYDDGVAQAAGDIHTLREAIRLTREYVGDRTLPAVPGWTWFDAIVATGGFEDFGGTCGCVLDPKVWGRPRDHHASDTGERKLFYCTLAPDHDGDHGLKGEPSRVCSGLCTTLTADAACPVHGIVSFLRGADT